MKFSFFFMFVFALIFVVRLIVMAKCGVECGEVMFKWQTTTSFDFKLLKSFGHGGLGKELWRKVPWIEDDVLMIKYQSKCLVEKKKLVFSFLVNFSFGEEVCKN